ncbi:MAG: lipopolysaccharide heptosyltransferase II [Deltaproteobacteria bacterium]|nr:lipopolysaccharide heptosyltransferase II [Deltaproteobacteria bacterium]
MPSSILVIKLSAIGDVVHSLPFLEVLRKNFPGARIDWIVEADAAPIVEGHEAIDRLFVSSRKPWQKRLVEIGNYLPVLREVARFVRELRGYRYELVIDLQGLLKSALLAGLVRGREKIGLEGVREGGWVFYNRPAIPVDYRRHAVDRYLQAADYLNCRRTGWDGKIPLTQRDRKRVDELLRLPEIGNRRIIAFNPMARWKTKLWSPEKFAESADMVSQKLSCAVVFTGSRSDRPLIRELSAQMKNPALNLAGRTSLKELAYLYSRCRALVCTDTGPMHIAAAMGCPVVALFGPTDPLRTGPYGAGHRVIRAGVACSPCFKKKCEQPICMETISTGQVFEAVVHVVQGAGKVYSN